MGIIKDPTSWRTGFELGLAGFSFPYSKPRKPTAYLYNGVRLPALPEWDREMYPFAYITTGEHGHSDTANYVLVLSSVECYRNSGIDIAPLYQKDSSGKCILYYYSQGENGFVYGKEISDTYLSSTSVILWTNTDLYTFKRVQMKPVYEFFMAASEPVPVYSTSEKTKYSYNGTVFPPLPVLPTEIAAIVPHVIMLVGEFEYGNALIRFAEEWLAGLGSDGSAIITADGATIDFYYDDTLELWVCHGQGFALSSIGYHSDLLLWSNRDILNKSDGTVYLAASEPIPVYE